MQLHIWQRIFDHKDSKSLKFDASQLDSTTSLVFCRMFEEEKDINHSFLPLSYLILLLLMVEIFQQVSNKHLNFWKIKSMTAQFAKLSHILMKRPHVFSSFDRSLEKQMLECNDDLAMWGKQCLLVSWTRLQVLFCYAN